MKKCKLSHSIRQEPQKTHLQLLCADPVTDLIYNIEIKNIPKNQDDLIQLLHSVCGAYEKLEQQAIEIKITS